MFETLLYLVLCSMLGDKHYQVRQKATTMLESLDGSASCVKYFVNSKNPEIARRAMSITDKLEFKKLAALGKTDPACPDFSDSVMVNPFNFIGGKPGTECIPGVGEGKRK